ncbi:Remodeling and spacing factor 1 [Taenia solium]
MYGLKPEAVESKADDESEAPVKISEFPEFAEICCFINHFGEKLGVLLTFPRIARLLSCETDADLQSLTTLVVKLLNKMRLRTQLNRWQPALGRFLQRHAYNCDELRFIGDGLNNGSPPTLFFLPPQCRLRVLLFCLETQFHLNVPFKEKVKTIDSHTLRTPPLGVDIFGNSYWLLVDTECNFLLYRSSAEDMTLELLSDSFSTLETVIDDLKDEKYEQTPISELYSIFRVSAKQEPTELINFPSPPTLPDIVAPREVKVDEPDFHVKPEAVELPERNPEKNEGEEKEVKEESAAEKCVGAPTESANEKPDSGVIVSSKDEEAQETLGLRRSGRKRRQVEFLAMESFHKGTKSRGKKSISISASKKARRTEGKLKKDKSLKEKTSKKRRRRRRGKKPRNGHNGSTGCLWTRSPEDSETDNEEDEDDDMWNDAGSNDPNDSSSSLQDGEKQSPRDWLEELESDFDLEAEDGGDSGIVAGRNLQRQKSQVLDEAPCQICTKSNHPEWLLLCDSCDLGFHAQCLRPALHLIPEGDWFCPRCLHTRLVTALVEQLSTLQARSKKLDSAARMQERLNFVNISVTNILRDERTRRPVVDSDSSSVESEESSHQARRKRSRYYESSGSTSDDISSSEEEGDDDGDDDEGEENEEEREEEDELPARTTRHRNVHYNVNAAFQQLDEVLVEDEKYAQERLERSKAKNQHSDHEEGSKDENAACGGPPMPGSVVLKTAKRKKLSSSSASSDSENRERRKRRRRVSPGSEEFRPSDESENDEDEDEEYEDEVELNSSTAESVSSDQSWKVGRRRRGRRHRRAVRRSRHRRGGRPSKGGRGRRIPHFEGPSSDEDGEDSVSLRRSSRVRVNYREIESSEEEEDERGGKETIVEKNPSRRRTNAASSGSEYAPSEEAEAVEEDEEEEEEEEEGEGIEGIQSSSSLAVKLPPIMSTEVEGEISQISNPIATSRELSGGNEPHIEEDSMEMVKDDPIFQNFVIDELVLPIQETENASDMRHGNVKNSVYAQGVDLEMKWLLPQRCRLRARVGCRHTTLKIEKLDEGIPFCERESKMISCQCDVSD